MKNKKTSEPNSHQRRETLAADVEKFLKAGNKIQKIDNGVSAQDGMGRSKQITLGSPKKGAAN